MSTSLEEIVARIEDPQAPLVWLDPSTPTSFWEKLPTALARHGYITFRLDPEAVIRDEVSLLATVARALGVPPEDIPNLNSLKDVLMGLKAEKARGWVFLYQHPEALRQSDERVFEDFTEIVEVVDERKRDLHQQVTKLVVTD